MDWLTKYLALVLIVLPLLISGCGNDNGEIGEYRYRTDMQSQPSFKEMESIREPVEGTVPANGYEPAIKDSATAAKLVNPIVWTEKSRDTSKFLFTTYCSPCHGNSAHGDGLVATKFQTPPDLTTEKYQRIADGYFVYVMQHGRLIMPPYYESVKAHERWLIVGYLRELQKK